MTEKTINIESVKVSAYRQRYGILTALGTSIREEGLRHPITVWPDGTLISGARRLRAHFLMAGTHEGARFRKIRAVFVDTIEAAAKRLLADNQDPYLADPLKPSELAELFAVLRKLDAPAAAKRKAEARKRGAELRKQTMQGERSGGRFNYSEDHLLTVVSQAFDMSEATASRLWRIRELAHATPADGDEKTLAAKMRAQEALQKLDNGNTSISGAYTAVIKGYRVPTSRTIKEEITPAPPARQLAAWARSLPALEGVTASLVELGPPHPDLTADQVAEVRSRLVVVRRDLEKIIRNMKKEISA